MSECCTPTSAPEQEASALTSFDVDRCTKAFTSVEEAREFMLAKDYDGHVLLTRRVEDGTRYVGLDGRGGPDAVAGDGGLVVEDPFV